MNRLLMVVLKNIAIVPAAWVKLCKYAKHTDEYSYEEKYKHVVEIHDYLISKLKDLDIYINSNSYCIPHVVNISLKNIKSEVMQHALEEYEVYVSTQTACATANYSKAVYAVTHDKEKASRSLRISISYLTTKEEIDEFIKAFSKCLSKLSFGR